LELLRADLGSVGLDNDSAGMVDPVGLSGMTIYLYGNSHPEASKRESLSEAATTGE